MVEDSVGSVIVGVGTTDDANERQVLTVRAGDRIQNAESADGERDDARADAAGPRVAVGGVPGIKLVTAADVVQPGLGD